MKKNTVNQLEQEFIPPAESFELKELGFDKPCFGRYHGRGGNKGKIWYEMPNSGQETIPVGDILAPTYRQAFKWFRDNHNLSGFALPFGENLFDFRIYSTKEGEHLYGSPEFPSTEEAELACIRRLIEIVKEQK